MTYERDGGRETGLKVVLDTNVYVSIFNWPASPLAELWWHARKGTYQLFVSPVIIDELGATLREEFSWSNADIIHHLRLITRVGKPARGSGADCGSRLGEPHHAGRKIRGCVD